MSGGGSKFWGMVGGVMVALKLKERYEDYSTLPGDEEGLGHGPVALRPNLDEDARDGASLLDTQLPNGRAKRQRRTDCCMCCGMRCGLFWKAFGIVCLLLAGWQLVRLILWAVRSKHSGLEGMPQFSTSLGCADAPYVYKGGKMEFSIPVGQNKNKGDHAVDFRGGIVGTLIVAQGEADLKDIKYEVTLRTDTEDLLQSVILDYPTAEEVNDNAKSSRVLLSVPPKTVDTCMRYDVKMYIPPGVQTLHLISHATTQVKFDPDSNFNLNQLYVTLYGMDINNMVLPTENIHATNMNLRLVRGWLVGDVTVVDSASLNTQNGDATMNVRIHPAPSSSDPPAPVRLLTSTGAGRTDVFFVNHPVLAHRPIDATHHSAMNADLYLTYTDAAFNGTVDIAAKSFSATGLQNAFKQDGDMPYVGSRNGGDKMSVRTQGWAGLYF